MKYKIVKDFLTREENINLLNKTLVNKNWKDSTIVNNAVNYRKSKVVYHLNNDIINLFENKIREIYKDTLVELNIDIFEISKIELQMVSSNNNDFFKPHPDADYINGSGDVKKRKLTIVYYYFNTPKPFSGGDLKIYKFTDSNRVNYISDDFVTVIPENNMLILFESDYWHEVTQIICNNEFKNSRFTINCWLQS